MGIQGLLPLLNPLVKEINICEYKNKRVAIDVAGWLVKGLYGACEDYVDTYIHSNFSNFIDNQLYVDFIISRVRHMITLGVTPIVVFDGKRNNLKAETQEKRVDARHSSLAQGRQLLANLKSTTDEACRVKIRAEAIGCFQRGLGVTNEMVKRTSK